MTICVISGVKIRNDNRRRKHKNEAREQKVCFEGMEGSKPQTNCNPSKNSGAGTDQSMRDDLAYPLYPLSSYSHSQIPIAEPKSPNSKLPTVTLPRILVKVVQVIFPSNLFRFLGNPFLYLLNSFKENYPFEIYFLNT